MLCNSLYASNQIDQIRQASAEKFNKNNYFASIQGSWSDAAYNINFACMIDI